MGSATSIGALVLLGVAFLLGWVQRVGKIAWEDIWDTLFGAMARVEVELSGQSGLAKRDAVLAAVFAYIDGVAPTSGVQRWILRSAIVGVINLAVNALNEGLSHDWIAAMDNAKHHIEAEMPWLADRAGGATPAPLDTPALG